MLVTGPGIRVFLSVKTGAGDGESLSRLFGYFNLRCYLGKTGASTAAVALALYAVSTEAA